MSGLDDYEWPSSFPRGVPPEESVPAAGWVYRAVNKVPPDEQDFLTSREEFPQREFNTNDEKLRSYGVSFFTKLSKLEGKIQKFNPLKNKVVVKGDLDKSLGVISGVSRQGHLTLWKCVDSKPHEYVKVPVSTSS